MDKKRTRRGGGKTKNGLNVLGFKGREGLIERLRSSCHNEIRGAVAGTITFSNDLESEAPIERKIVRIGRFEITRKLRSVSQFEDLLA